MKVSVILNCYNGERFLREAIDSIYRQTHQNFEIIFWDNASTDNSQKIAKSYDSRLKYFRSFKTTPLGEARSRALKKATGDYIGFIDCDDVWLPYKLQCQLDVMEKEECILTYGSFIIIDENGGFVRRVKTNKALGSLFVRLLNKYEISMQSVLIKTSFLRAKNLTFDQTLSYCPDYDLFMRIAAEARIGVIEDDLIKYRVVKNSLSEQLVSVAPDEIRYCLRKLYSDKIRGSRILSIAFKKAYSKTSFHDAISDLKSGNKHLARRHLKKIIFVSPTYLVIFMALYLPFSANFLLRVLRR